MLAVAGGCWLMVVVSGACRTLVFLVDSRVRWCLLAADSRGLDAVRSAWPASRRHVHSPHPPIFIFPTSLVPRPTCPYTCAKVRSHMLPQ